MIGLAIIFGVFAVFLSNFWLNGRQPEAAVISANTHAEDMVVVAAQPLRFGDRLTTDNLREIPWTAGALPAGAFHHTSDLLNTKLGAVQLVGRRGIRSGSQIRSHVRHATVSIWREHTNRSPWRRRATSPR